jgi:hypothetical protein
MRHATAAVVILTLLAAGLAARVAAQPAGGAGACAQITAACESAGFTQGGASSGTGLIADCVAPIMQGTAQPRRARNPLPPVDPQLVAECRTSNPRFGQAGAPAEPPAQPTPANPARNPPAPAAAAEVARPCGVGDANLPNGLVVVLPPGRQRERAHDLQALNSPLVSGVAMQIDWRDLEPVQGRPDWATLDELFGAAESSHKWVQLLLFPGFFSPAWALQGAETEMFPIPYGPGHGEVARLPMPWDKAYLARWFSFLEQLSARYASAASFRVMAAAGPTSVSAEMTLPIKPSDVALWARHGYTPQRYLDAWESVFHTYAGLFPNQCVSLSGPGLPLLDHGKVIDKEAHMRAREAIVNQASRALGRRFVVQWSDLHAGRAAVEAPDQTDFIISLSGRMITGLQLRTSAENDSAVMGAPGNPPLALRKSIDKGMQPNSAGRHVNYLEVYEPDVLAADMQPTLRYAASLFDGAARR